MVQFTLEVETKDSLQLLDFLYSLVAELAEGEVGEPLDIRAIKINGKVRGSMKFETYRNAKNSKQLLRERMRGK